MNLVETFKEEKIAINCETEHEAEKFIKWCDDNKLEVKKDTRLNSFHRYNQKTCYEYNYDNYEENSRIVYYGSSDYFEEKEGYKVIKYKDFLRKV